MKTNEKTDTVLALTLPVAQGDGLSSMPEAFEGVFQAGFESGYSSGRDAGYRQGFAEGFAAAHKDAPSSAAVTPALEGKPAQKGGPRRMLVGMPCVRCRLYLHSDETHCPCCQQARAA
jgi:hypothetical protein